MINKINKKTIIITMAIVLMIIIIILNFDKKNNEIIIDNVETETITEEQEKTKEPKKIMIHITGCIRNQGVIEIEEGSRIVDVIEKAGGVTEEADISKINLAYIVKDAQKIYIPSIDDTKTEYISTENGENVIVENNVKGENSMVNINSATQTELEQLPGIGPSTALKIINYREKNGKFKTIEDIKQVQGIGDAKFNNIKDMIEV